MNDPLALSALALSFGGTQTEARVRANKVPVLALIGELDPMKSLVDPLKDLMPNLKIVVIPKANHMTAPCDREFIKSLKAFLMEHSAIGTAKGFE